MNMRAITEEYTHTKSYAGRKRSNRETNKQNRLDLMGASTGPYTNNLREKKRKENKNKRFNIVGSPEYNTRKISRGKKKKQHKRKQISK